MSPSPASKWPKILSPLTPEQQRRSDEFMKLWHVELAGRSRYGQVERFNHGWSVRNSPAGFRTTLEIGAGLGEHLDYENLTPEQARGYYCNEYRDNMAADIKRRHPQVQTVVGDCQSRMDFADEYFDRILAIHVLEHLPDLPACLAELHRLINKSTGRLLIVIPTEGSPPTAWRAGFPPSVSGIDISPHLTSSFTVVNTSISSPRSSGSCTLTSPSNAGPASPCPSCHLSFATSASPTP